MTEKMSCYEQGVRGERVTRCGVMSEDVICEGVMMMIGDGVKCECGEIGEWGQEEGHSFHRLLRLVVVETETSKSNNN